jgi:outer membrane protein TolC
MRKLAFLLLLATITIGLSAEGYTLEQLIEYGMNNASSIAKSELNKDSAYSNHLSSWLDFLPDAGISYNRFKNETSESESASYTISKAISLNEGEYFQFRNTQLERTAADLSLESTKKNLAYTILESYLTILQNQKELEIQQENLALQDKMFQEISLQVKQGRKTAIDQNQTEIDKIDSQIQIDNLSNSIMDMRADLFAMLKMDDNGEPFSEVTLSINSIDALPSVKSISPDNNDNPFSFKIDYLNLKKMKINEWQNKLSFLPSITFSASYDQVSTVDQVSEFDNYNESYSFGVSASYSLWNIFNEGERYRRYRNNLKSTEIDLQDRIEN